MVLGISGIIPNLFIGLISVIALVYGADVVVNKMEKIAKYFGVSEVFIAMTIISIGTSLPEITLHMVGSFNILTNPSNLELYRTVSATVLGSNIGSDVVQQTLVLGLVLIASALLKNQFGFKFSKKFLLRDYAPMMGTTLMTLILAWDRTLSRIDGLILFGSFLSYIYYLYTTRDEKITRESDVEPSKNIIKDTSIGLISLILLIVSAHLFLEITKIIIEKTGLSGSMIGVATVGIVSASPEMLTAISGLRKGAEGISLGTLIGSNITNPLLAIGLGSLISTYAVPKPLILWDLPMETITAAVLLAYLFGREEIGDVLAFVLKTLGLDKLGDRVDKAQDRVLTVAGAFLLVILYIIYMYVRFKYFGVDFA